jgi:hypothetical protein
MGLAVTLVAAIVIGCGGGVPSPSPTAVATPTPTPDPHLADPATADEVFLALGAAGLRLTANNAASGPEDGALVKRINATFLGWPLSVSEYRTSAVLAETTAWESGDGPDQGEPPVAIAGMNILIEWGPTTGAEPKRPAGPQVEGLRQLADALDRLLSPLRARSVVPVPNAVAPTPDPSAEASAESEATPKP